MAPNMGIVFFVLDLLFLEPLLTLLDATDNLRGYGRIDTSSFIIRYMVVVFLLIGVQIIGGIYFLVIGKSFPNLSQPFPDPLLVLD